MKNTFILQLKNRFQVLADTENLKQPDTCELNIKWEQVKAYSETSEACHKKVDMYRGTTDVPITDKQG